MNELVDALMEVRAELLRGADGVAEDARNAAFVGHWDLMDLLAHLIGWDYANLEAIEALEASRAPAFYAHQDAGWAGYNEKLIEKYGSRDWQVLRRSIDASSRAIEERLWSLSGGGLTRQHEVPGRTRPVTIVGILRAAIRDEREHLAQIEAFAAERT